MSKRASLSAYLTIIVCILSIPAAANAKTIHVDDDAPADFNNIQAAIDDSNDGDTIIIAEGTYERVSLDGKNITLRSTNPTNPETVAATIIDGNDVGAVITFQNGENANCVLSGFTITGGYSNGVGGGICCSNSSPTIANCIIKDNETTHSRDYSTRPPGVDGGGGGLYCDSSNPTITNCGFINNSATYMGGGMHSLDSNPKLTNCIFSRNSITYRWRGDGGGMHNISSSPFLSGCTFSENSAQCYGGGMWNDNSNPVLRNCTFSRNSALSGGGMWNGSSDAILINCIFSRNSADYAGGMSNAWWSNSTLINCTFSKNLAKNYFGGIWDGDGNSKLTNCILWGNSDSVGEDESAQIHNTNYGDTFINYSCIQGWTGAFDGIGNIGEDPMFVDPGYWDPNGTPADANDDYFVEGDYHLKSQTGRYDPNTETRIQDDETSPGIDAGDPMTPIMHEPFPNGGVVNMGAYGGTAEASKSYFGKPPCETIVAGDINGDCEVNFLDFRLMSLHWMEER